MCVWGGEKGEVGKEKGEKEMVLECGRPLSVSSKCMAVGYLHRLCMNTLPACLSIVCVCVHACVHVRVPAFYSGAYPGT